jgi:hypothetical protein
MVTENKNQYKGFTILAIFTILSGVLLLGENYGVLPAVHNFWPLASGALGAGFLLLYRSGKLESLLVGIGTYLICFSVLALICNYTSWRILKHAWPLFIGFLGISMLSIFFFARRQYLYLSLGSGLIMLALVFFFVFSVDPLLWPLSLIMFGISVLLLNYFRIKRGEL